MTYKYSVCYPDKEEIEFFDDIIEKEQVFNIVKKFDWEHELKKEGDWYSPSLDFVNLTNKKRLILSGLGDGELINFQIMFILPNNENALEAFDDKNYYMAEDYSSECSIEESYEILDEFLNKNYDKIISRLKSKGNINSGIKSDELIKEYIEKGILPKGNYEIIHDEVSGNIEIREIKTDDELIKESIEKGILAEGDYEIIRNEVNGNREIRAIKKDDELIKEYIERGILPEGNYEIIRDEVSGRIEFREVRGIEKLELVKKNWWEFWKW